MRRIHLRNEIKVNKALTVGDLSTAAATGTDPAGASEGGDVGFIEWPTSGDTTSRRYDYRYQTTNIGGTDLVEPPADPVSVYKIFEESAYLPAIVDTLLVNVYCTGYHLAPVIDTDAPDARAKFRSALAWQAAGGDLDAVAEISEEQVDEAIAWYKRRAALEYELLREYFSVVSPENTWKDLWARTGHDLEVLGYAYWEVQRSSRTPRKPARLRWVPAVTMRVCSPPGAKDYIVVQDRVKLGLNQWQPVFNYRRFVKYAQLSRDMGDNIAAYFKEYGDPRIMSRRTGRYYPDIDSLLAAEDRSLHNALNKVSDDAERQAALLRAEPLVATEILQHTVPGGLSNLYGYAKWLGTAPSIIGARELEEENLRNVKDESIPQLLLLIGGGVIGQKSYERMLDKMRDRKKGRKGILVLEANSSAKIGTGTSQQPTIHVERLKTEQHSDALFLNYERRAEEKALGAFRLPKSELGKDLGTNKDSTSATARFAQNQVYSPRRSMYVEDPMNTKILPDLGIRCWEYRANVPQPMDPEMRAKIISTLIDKGVLTINESRRLASPIFSETLLTLEALWSKMPPRVLTIMLQTKNKEIASALLGNDANALVDLAEAASTTLGLDTEDGAGLTDQTSTAATSDENV